MPIEYDISLSEFIERMSEEHPNKSVLFDKGQTYNWKELNHAAEEMAGKLGKNGVQKGTHVGLCASNSAEWITCFFAIQKLDAIAILVNPQLHPKEIATHSDIADITFFCFGKSNVSYDKEDYIKEISKHSDCCIRAFYDIDDGTLVRADSGFDGYATDDEAAFMLFSSGSTGRPKCAMMTARNLLTSARESAISQRLDSNDKNCLILPLFHIFGLVAGLFASFISGAVIILPKDMKPGTLLDTIENEKCTVFHAVPTLMLMLINYKDFAPDRLKRVRCSILSGAAATKEQIILFKKIMPDNHFLVAYGLTECAPISTLPYADSVENCVSTVGKPMSHIELRITDLTTNVECDFGEVGEIVVRGSSMMCGYYNVPQEDNIIDIDGWLHTGDLGYLNAEGYLCFSGRKKEIIKRGGETIMPLEIAGVLGSLPEIEDVKVVGVPSDFFGEEVCACIRMKKDAIFDEISAREYLKDRIASFKIPAYFLVYEQFPSLATGKVDMVSLRKDAANRI